jgi:hypothetical protein
MKIYGPEDRGINFSETPVPSGETATR